MKKTLLFMALIASCVAASAQSLNRLPGSYILASASAGSYTNRDASTLNVLISGLDAREAVIIIDDGEWDIDEDVTFPTNLCVWVTPPAYFTVTNGVTLTLNGCLEAYDGAVFQGGGTVTGTPTYLHYYTAWNAPAISNSQTSVLWDKDYTDDVTTNNIVTALTNQAPYVDLDYRDDITNIVKGTEVSGGSVTITNGEATIHFSSSGGGVDFSGGYIDGMIPTYSNATIVTVSPGSIVVGGSTYSSTTSTNMDMTTTLAGIGSRDFIYFYMDVSASVSNAPVFIANTTDPTYQTDGTGFYSGNDRCIGAVRTTEAGSGVYPFYSSPKSGRKYLVQRTGRDGVVDQGKSTVFSSSTETTYAAMNANSFTGIDDAIPVNSDVCYMHAIITDTTLGQALVAKSTQVGIGDAANSNAFWRVTQVSNSGYSIYSYGFSVITDFTASRPDLYFASRDLDGGSSIDTAWLIDSWEVYR